MFRLWFFLLFLPLTSVVGAQTPANPYQDMQSMMEAAQAGAKKPGDASLSCEALESELVATAQQPALQSYIAKSGAAAQDKLKAMNSAPNRMAAQGALTLFSSIVPGGAWAGHTAAVTQAQAQRAQAAQNIQQRMQQAQEMMSIMPQMMRGQHLIELAQARNCSWLNQK